MERQYLDGYFLPSRWSRNPHLQSVFGSLKLRLRGGNPMKDAAVEMIIDAGSGALLHGYYSKLPPTKSRGLIALIHGWEGSADSTYMLSTGKYLYDRGYEIFRLNLRDHGNSHHLNKGLFHGALLEETFSAMVSIAGLAPNLPFYLIGFSLGANFVLRIALCHGSSKIGNLRHAICISPALDPHKSTLGIDKGLALYRHYFLRKWKRSLRRKADLFPELYNFDALMKLDSCMALTEAIMPYYPDFPTYRDYFRQYTLLGDALNGLSVPTTIYASVDDPISPADDCLGLTRNDFLHLELQRYGGHCGFLDPFPSGCWYERKIASLLDQQERQD
ncbi:MAG: alpha/beta fold hydrolase [Smithellaceae bacterium]|nr:alpha/beta fold hydrolase [Smithellaceae bacterium]